MTSFVSARHLATQENQDRQVKSVSRQTQNGRSTGIPQKQFHEQTPRQRQPLGVLNNSTVKQSWNKGTTKASKDVVTLKPAHKSGTSSVKRTHKTTPTTETAALLETGSPLLEELTDIESLPTLDNKDAHISPFVEPPYFKNLTAALKHTTVAPPPRSNLLDIPTRLTLQSRPKEQLESLLACDESSVDQTCESLLDLPPLPDIDW